MPEWQVKVHLVEGRNIKSKTDGLSDPIVSVEVAGSKQWSKVFSNTTAAMFDQQFFFTFDCTKDDMDGTGIGLILWDQNVMSSTLIGEYDMDCGYVYKKPGHEIYRQWAPMLDTEVSGSDVQGYLKISVTVLGEGDEPVSHTPGDEDGDEDDDPTKMVLEAPSMDKEGYHLFLRVYKAEGLPKMDLFTKADSFVQVKFAGNPIQRTKTVQNDLNPSFNQEIRLPVMVPTMANTVNVEIYDEGKLGGMSASRLIGKVPLKFNEILQNDINPTWFNLYGDPMRTSTTDKVTDVLKAIGSVIPMEALDSALGTVKADRAPELSAYNGRLLLAAECQKAETPKLGQKGVASAKPPKTDMYLVRFELLEGSDIAISSWTYETCVVELQCGSSVLEGDPVAPKDGRVVFYQSFLEAKLALPVETADIHDFFINVYKVNPVTGHKSRIGYKRIRADSIDGFNVMPKWELLRPDPGKKMDIGAIPGYLQYCLKFGRERNKPSKRRKFKKPKLIKYELRAHIFQGRNLIASDETGGSDPYVIVSCAGQKGQTEIVKETLFPIYFHTITLEVDLPKDLALAPEVNVMVMDWDQLTSHDMMGRFTMPAHRIKPAMPRRPKWRKLYLNDPDKGEGEMLLAFQLIPKPDVGQFPPQDIHPEVKECILEIACIGLRDVKEYYLFPVDAPHVEFDAGEINKETGELKKKQTKQTTSFAGAGSTRSANFLQVIPMPISVPVDPLFAQNINIRVIDNRTFTSPLVGLAALEIGDFIQWTVEVDTESESEDDHADDDDGDDLGEWVPPEIDLWNHDTPEELVFSTLKPGEKGKSDRADVAEEEVDHDDEEEDEGNKNNEREKIDDELEDDERLKENIPFQEFPLSRGNAQGGGPFGGAQAVGILKANIRLMEMAKRNTYAPPPNLKKDFAPETYVIRTYVLRGLDVTPQDSDGLSDPYLVIKAGGNVDNFVDNKCDKTLNPDFYCASELKTKLPGDATLKVEVWDYDLALTHDIIGETNIDLENRIFNKGWTDFKKKPIEYRTLHNPSKKAAQGKVEMWVDILTLAEAMQTPMIVLEPPAPQDFMVRVVIWNARQIVNDEEPNTDLYVEGVMSGEGQSMQATDTHGKSNDIDCPPAFNWRFLFPVELYDNQEKNPRLKLSIWDQDLIGSNDAIGEAIIALKPLYKKAMKKNESVKLEDFWVKFTHPNFEGVRGQVRVEIEVMPRADHDLSPVGKARNAPNENPFLEFPPNRPSLLDGLGDLLNFDFFGGLKKKLMRCCGCVAVVLVLYVMLTMM